jgi:hypothetical protein
MVDLAYYVHRLFCSIVLFGIVVIKILFTFNLGLLFLTCGPGISVGIVTGYGLNGPGTKSRWRAKFSAPVQIGPGTHPASCTMDTESFPGAKSDRGVTLTFHLLLVPLVMTAELYLYSTYGPYGLYRALVPVQGCSLTYFTFTITTIFDFSILTCILLS